MTSKTAAFFRVEGTLLKRGSLSAAAYFAANGQGFRERALRLGQLAIASPLLGLLRQNDGTTVHRAAYAACRNMSEDRVLFLAEEFAEDYLRKQVLDSGLDLIVKARREGHRIVLISENIAEVVVPVAAAWRGVDELHSNRLEFSDGKTTGRLLDPVFGGHETARWIRQYAQTNDLDLSKCVAYASNGTDLLTLAAVGQPCAVNSDFTLRRAAIESRWPLLDFSA